MDIGRINDELASTTKTDIRNVLGKYSVPHSHGDHIAYHGTETALVGRVGRVYDPYGEHKTSPNVPVHFYPSSNHMFSRREILPVAHLRKLV
jgi:hypothetical protein